MQDPVQEASSLRLSPSAVTQGSARVIRSIKLHRGRHSGNGAARRLVRIALIKKKKKKERKKAIVSAYQANN